MPTRRQWSATARTPASNAHGLVDDDDGRQRQEAQQTGQITTAITAETLAWILMGIAEVMGARWARCR